MQFSKNILFFYKIAPNFCYPSILFRKIGGDEEIRTPDPLLARQVLSQLSYAPMMGPLKSR